MVLSLSEVLPDVHSGGPPQGKADAADAASTRLQNRITKFMRDCLGDGEAEAAAEKNPQRQSNIYYLLALDQSLEGGAGLAIAHFVAKAPLRPLKPHERQYFAELDPTRFPVPAGDPPGRKRSCVVDLRSGNTRVESPFELNDQGEVLRPALHCASDDGPVGRPSMHYLYCDLDVRGTRVRDYSHKNHNLVKMACVEAGVYIIVLETVVGFNLPGGPWDGDAFFNGLVSTGRAFLATAGYTNGIFQHFYENICKERGLVGHDFNTKTHQQQVWDSLRFCKTLQRKGAKVKLGRWLGWFRALDEKKSEWSIFLMFVVVLGIEKNLWKSVWDSPLHGRSATGEWFVQEDAAAEPAQEAASSSDAPPQTMKHSNAVLKKERQSSSGSMDFVVKIFSDRFKYKAAMLIEWLAKPITEHLAEALHTHHDKDKAWKLEASLCAGGAWQVASTVFQRLQDPRILRVLEADTTKPGGEEDSAEEREFTILAARGLGLAWRLAKYWTLAHLQHIASLPDAFCLLLCETGSKEMHMGLSRAKELFEYMRSGEQLAPSSTFVEGVLKSWGWPSWQWVREILVSLSEFDFEIVPPDVARACQAKWHGFQQTVIIEDAMQMFEGVSHESKNKMLCRAQRWRRLQISSIMDEYSRTTVEVPASIADDAARKLPKETFEPKNREFSLGAEKLKGLSDPAWSSPSPQTVDAVPLSILALRFFEGDWLALDGAWMSLLVPEGRMIFKPKRGYMGIALCASKFGFLHWGLKKHVKMTRDNPLLVFDDPGPDDLCPWRFDAVKDLGEWRVYKLRLTRPLLSAASTGEVGLAIRPESGTSESLLEAAARLAFPSMTVPLLERLFDELKVKYTGRKPKAENSLLSALIQHALPESTPEDIRSIIAQRNNKVIEHGLPSDLSNPDIFDAISGLACEQDLEDMEKYVKAHAAACSGRGGGQPASSGSGGAGASSSARLPNPTPAGVPEVSVMTADSLRPFLPQVQGCSLTLEQKWHTRWKVCYLQGQPTFSFSRVYNPDTPGACEAAAMACIAWAWGKHTEATGEECPLDLTAFAGSLTQDL